MHVALAMLIVHSRLAWHQDNELLPGSKQAFHAMLLEVNYKQRRSGLGLGDLGCPMAQGSAEPPHAGMTSVQNVNVQTQAFPLEERACPLDWEHVDALKGEFDDARPRGAHKDPRAAWHR